VSRSDHRSKGTVPLAGDVNLCKMAGGGCAGRVPPSLHRPKRVTCPMPCPPVRGSLRESWVDLGGSLLHHGGGEVGSWDGDGGARSRCAVLVGMASLGESSTSATLVLHPQGVLKLTDVVVVGGVHRLAGESLNILSGSAGDAGECPPAMAEVVCDAEWG
jgi:hypothetical protein